MSTSQPSQVGIHIGASGTPGRAPALGKMVCVASEAIVPKDRCDPTWGERIGGLNLATFTSSSTSASSRKLSPLGHGAVARPPHLGPRVPRLYQGTVARRYTRCGIVRSLVAAVADSLPDELRFDCNGTLMSPGWFCGRWFMYRAEQWLRHSRESTAAEG